MKARAIIMFLALLAPTVAYADGIAGETVVAELMGKQVAYAELSRGETLSAEDAGQRLFGTIFGRLLSEYKTANNIEPTKDEMDIFVEGTRRIEERIAKEDELRMEELRQKIADPKTSPKEKESSIELLNLIEKNTKTRREWRSRMSEERRRELDESTGKVFVLRWKINKSLYDKYGGRVIFQQAGPEPLDAYREFIEEAEKNGKFKILRDELRDGFWKYCTNERMHTFYREAEGSKIMNTPWWALPDSR